jgi:hypothetical protein
VRAVPVRLHDVFAVDLGHLLALVPGPVIAIEAQQYKRRNDQQKQQHHDDFGVLANEIKHLEFPVRLLTDKNRAQQQKRRTSFAFFSWVVGADGLEPPTYAV